MSATAISPVEKFTYKAYPHQLAFHASPAKYRLLGGAAGPGKTFALIMDHMMHCNRFSLQDAPQVHTLLLRRTHPKLLDTVITRFYEKIPKELYLDFNQQEKIVTWRNGATTKFGSMQHEHDVWGYQGQWYKIGYDELTEFTFKQWQNISAWNRCPVSKHSTKDGATNPIGIGAPWVEKLFVQHRPCKEMDKKQASEYNEANYAYFPATYLENPIYANDPNFIANLDSYQAAVSDALKYGKWGVAGGYFDGAWDEAVNVYPAASVEILPRWKKWLGGDWGFEHNFAIHWFAMDDYGIVRIYREWVDNHHSPEQLGEGIVKRSIGSDGKPEKFDFFSLSHDAFAQRADPNTFAIRIGNVLAPAGLCRPSPSTKDKPGREQILYDKLRSRIGTGRKVKDADGNELPVEDAGLQIADNCKDLIDVIGNAPRDEDNREEIAEFLGDDSLQSSGYGLYAMFGKPAKKPIELRIKEKLEERIGMKVEEATPEQYTHVMMQRAIVEQQEKKSDKPFKLIGRHRRRR